jgi:hypothetical protein
MCEASISVPASKHAFDLSGDVGEGSVFEVGPLGRTSVIARDGNLDLAERGKPWNQSISDGCGNRS